MMLESGQVLRARYTLLRKLGDGRTSEGWLVRDRETSRDCVLKVLRPKLAADPEERDRFVRAALLQQQVRHHNVLRCNAVHQDDPVCAVFEHVAGGDLSTWRGRDWRQLLPLLAQVAAGASELHARGFVHRDLKTTNVLIGDDGRALLTDLGLAASIGDAAAKPGGSPFSSSPQQLDGAPPSVADDVYAFGVLAYELLTGYPPFYPVPAPERVRAEPPAPMQVRAPMPQELERLVLQCLAKQPEDRPQDLLAVGAQLRRIAEASSVDGVSPVPSERIELRPPQPSAPVIQPQWQRPAAAGPSAEELRSQGFRRGLVAGALVFLLVMAGFVFFVLPRWVEKREAVQAPDVPAASAPQPKPAAGTEPDLQRLAEAKRQYEEARPPVAERLAGLDARGAASWGGDAYARGRQGLADADGAFGARDYEVALARLRDADRDLAAVEKLAATTLRNALAAGLAAIDAGNAAAARMQFDLAARIDPASDAAKRGLQRAATLDEVRRLMTAAADAERAGQVPAAEASYRKALQLDPDARAARDALVRLQSAAAGVAFAAAVSQGLAALSRADYGTARAAFERAGQLRPGSPEVQDGLARVERALGDRTIGAHLVAAQQAEREERWSNALAEYRKALEIDRNLLTAQQGVERAEPRAMLDAELAAYLERPDRLFSSDVRGAARAALARARAVPGPGPVLTRQISAVNDLVAAAETPVRVALASDNQTEVTIYRVGKLGIFDRKDMELLPGRYTVVGTRAGFRDVRRELTVLPGREAPVLVIRCEEQI